MTCEIYTSKDGRMKVARGKAWCDECGQLANCAKFETYQAGITLCIPCFANLMHYIIAGRKHDG